MTGEMRVHKTKRGEIKVEKVDELEYRAKSESKDDEWYRVVYVLGKFHCECKGFAHTDRACKHISAVNHRFSPKPPPERRRRARRRKKMVIGTPGITCSHCMSKKYKEAYVRENKLRDAQVYTCLAEGCGRNFTPDDGFKYKTYTKGHITMALGDRACAKLPHDISDTIAKDGRRPARSTLYAWNRDYPALVGPYLISLDYQLSDTMLTDEIIVKVSGVPHVIFTTMDEGTRVPTGNQMGCHKGSHNVVGLFLMDALVRRRVPNLVRSDGAVNYHSAYIIVIKDNGEGVKTMHIRHIHLTGDKNPNMKERDNGSLRDFVRSCRGLKKLETAYIALYQTHFLIARTHSGVGMTPLEAAGISFEDPDKWRALINNAAAYNNARRLGLLIPDKEIPDRQAGFRVLPTLPR